MKNAIRNLVLVGLFFFAISFDSCTLGVDYDRKYKLYPEIDGYSCIFMNVYGKRWERLGFVTFFFGTSIMISAFIALHRKLQNADKGLSIYSRDN